MSPHQPSRVALLAAFAAVYFFWGATFLAVRYALVAVPPILIIVIRCTGGALILGSWLAWRRQLERPTLAQWRTAAIAGLFLFLGSHVSIAWAEQRMSSGQAALYTSTIPLWIVLMESARERAVPSARVLVGIVLGIVGVGVLAGGGALNAGLLSDRVIISLSAFCWAAGSLVGRYGARPTGAIQATAMQLATGAGWTLMASALHGDFSRFALSQLTTRSVLALLFLVLCGTVLAFASFTWLMRVASPAAVSSYAFVNPIVALALGILVGDDALTGRVVISAILVVGAVVLTMRSASSEPAIPRDTPLDGENVPNAIPARAAS
ncbi:MAG TPA: EamA family transporter [Gemmatimonadaceae bacterium]|nr:EamA family transporter [Gemmatimonadaceae bacterium]